MQLYIGIFLFFILLSPGPGPDSVDIFLDGGSTELTESEVLINRDNDETITISKSITHNDVKIRKINFPVEVSHKYSFKNPQKFFHISFSKQIQSLVLRC